MARAKRLDNPNQIIDATLELIEKDGLQEFSTRRLSNKLNISATTLYNYYENKEAILRDSLITSIQKFSTQQFELLKAKLKSGENPLKYFKMLPESLLNFGTNHPYLYKFMFDINNSKFLDDSKVVEQYKRGFTIVERHIVNPKDFKQLHCHVYLYEVISNTLVMRVLDTKNVIKLKEFIWYSKEAYDMLLAPDEDLLKPLDLTLI
ncbi:hypothetical protein MASR2M48_33630 [Spirochaetota bacterium]